MKGRKKMELKSIYEGLKENLNTMAPRMKELEMEIEDYRERLEAAESELKELQDKQFALKSAMENLELIELGAEEQKSKIDKLNEVNKIIRQPIKQPRWTRKSGRLVQRDRNDLEIGCFVSQKAAARKLNWDQSSISRFIKSSKEEQIRKKNFYFKWEF